MSVPSNTASTGPERANPWNSLPHIFPYPNRQQTIHLPYTVRQGDLSVRLTSRQPPLQPMAARKHIMQKKLPPQPRIATIQKTSAKSMVVDRKPPEVVSPQLEIAGMKSAVRAVTCLRRRMTSAIRVNRSVSNDVQQLSFHVTDDGRDETSSDVRGRSNGILPTSMDDEVHRTIHEFAKNPSAYRSSVPQSEGIASVQLNVLNQRFDRLKQNGTPPCLRVTRMEITSDEDVLNPRSIEAALTSGNQGSGPLRGPRDLRRGSASERHHVYRGIYERSERESAFSHDYSVLNPTKIIEWANTQKSVAPALTYFS